LRLWVEHAQQSLVGTGLVPAQKASSRAVSTFQTEQQFLAVLVGCPQPGAGGEMQASQMAEEAAGRLKEGEALDTVADGVLASLPQGEHVPISILQVLGGCQADLWECDAPPLFITRRGRLFLPPIVEEVLRERLVRYGHFPLEDGDHLAIVSEEYIHARGWDRRWGWRDIALSIRRLTDTGCDAEQLLGALVRTYHRLAQGESEPGVAVVAMHVRPLRSATVWSGPPADPAWDERTVERFMAEAGTRIICGDTTALIASRVLGTSLEREPRPGEGWGEVPPTSRMQGVDLVTEGVVTLRKARDRIAKAGCVRDLPRSSDGATRLACLLLGSDTIHFLVGGAVNPAQMEGNVPWRYGAAEDLASELRAHGKIVSVEYVG